MALLTTTSDVNVNVKGYYDRTTLERALPLLVFDRWAQIKPLPKNEGDMITFRRYGSLATAPQLDEGVTPTGKKATTTDINTTLVQFGDFLTTTDRLSMTSLDSTLVEFAEVLGEQAGDTIDQYHRDKMVAGTNVRYANGVSARTSVATVPSANDLKEIVRILEGNNSRKLRRMIPPSTKVGTVGVRPSYIGICHTDARADLEDIPDFRPVSQYPSQSGVLDGEIGEYRGIRFVGTTNAKIHTDSGSSTVGSMVTTSGSQTDVYITMIFGANFYGTVPLQKKSIENIVMKMGSAGTSDPLKQRATSGWKAFVAGIILDEDNGVRLEHCVTDL